MSAAVAGWPKGVGWAAAPGAKRVSSARVRPEERGAKLTRPLVTKLHLVTHLRGKLHFPWRGCLRAALDAQPAAGWPHLRSATSRAIAFPSATGERGALRPLPLQPITPVLLHRHLRHLMILLERVV